MAADKRQAVIIVELFKAYGKADQVERMKVYVKRLMDIPAELLGPACEKAVYESAFLPSIAELVASARELAGEATGRRIKGWAEACLEIEKAMQGVGFYGRPTFSTPEIAQAVEAYGWRSLCTATAEGMPTVRAQLRKLYEGVCARRTAADLNAYILGRAGVKELGARAPLFLAGSMRQGGGTP